MFSAPSGAFLFGFLHGRLAALPLVNFKTPEPRGFARRVGNGLVDAADMPPLKEDVVAFRAAGVGIALQDEHCFSLANARAERRSRKMKEAANLRRPLQSNLAVPLSSAFVVFWVAVPFATIFVTAARAAARHAGRYLSSGALNFLDTLAAEDAAVTVSLANENEGDRTSIPITNTVPARYFCICFSPNGF